MTDLDSDVEIEPDGGLEDGDEGLRRKKKLSGKRLTLFVILPLLLLGGGGAGTYYSGVADPLLAEILAARSSDKPARKVALYYDLPELLVNINSGANQSNFLRLRVALEIEDAEAARELDVVLPRIIDNFQVYLRELRLEDLSGSAGLFRLKEELLVRVNAAVAPIRVNDVLFKEMIVQ